MGQLPAEISFPGIEFARQENIVGKLTPNFNL